LLRSAPAVQVKTINASGIHLQDGLILPSACIFLRARFSCGTFRPHSGKGGGKSGLRCLRSLYQTRCVSFSQCAVMLFNFESEILLLGTGKSVLPPPAPLRHYLNELGIQLDVMSTVRALPSPCTLLRAEHVVTSGMPVPRTTSCLKRAGVSPRRCSHTVITRGSHSVIFKPPPLAALAEVMDTEIQMR